MTTEQQYKDANKSGLKHRSTGDFWSYYTPSLQIAYNLGVEGISIQDVEPIIAFRFGKAPESFISFNYRDSTSENGLSVYTDSSIIRSEFSDRSKFEYVGLPVGNGGDGELLILAFDADNLDF